MSAGNSSMWKTLLVPPIFAFLLYILTTYLLVPYYRRFRSHSSYTLLPSSLAPSNSPTSAAFAHGLLSRVNALIGGNSRRVSGESLMGDEELEEGGFTILDNSLTGGRLDEDSRSNVDDGERRLSRELERGFRDSSDEDDDDRRRARR
ncbi:hypothetical protein N7G274_008154 [Stereocaulon virgatum]|uniref:Uncharacterized protein n=1 Tax=Stereocaulon virgatum TaxID=373712 RepID=A0ABR4A220_9LECA